MVIKDSGHFFQMAQVCWLFIFACDSYQEYNQLTTQSTSGFNKSGFKQRKGKRRPITDERSVPDDPTKPLGAGDPIPVSIGYRTLLHILNVNF